MNSLPLKYVIEQMELNKTFSIQFVQANTQTGIAGEIMSINLAILAKHQPTHKIATKVYNKKKRNRQNDANGIRLIFDKEAKRLISIHIRLITHFNNIPVRYGS